MDVANMSAALPVIYLARHGETAWSITGQHTGLTDLPLTERGERNARRLGQRLKDVKIKKVLTSPLERAMRTCELSGFCLMAQVDRDLVEWDYGQYEGRTTAQIRAERPGWQLFKDGCPGGETPEEVGSRADRIIEKVRTMEANVLLFSSADFLRVLAARWLGLEPAAGRLFVLGTASLSAVGFDNDAAEPVIRFWDDTRHVGD